MDLDLLLAQHKASPELSAALHALFHSSQEELASAHQKVEHLEVAAKRDQFTIERLTFELARLNRIRFAEAPLNLEDAIHPFEADHHAPAERHGAPRLSRPAAARHERRSRFVTVARDLRNLLRVGRQANTSIGRFVRLWLRNVCGYRIPPGSGDSGAIGQTFHVALAEDEDAARSMGWPTYAEERGFAASDSVVTVQSVNAVTPPTNSASLTALEHVERWLEIMGPTFTSRLHSGYRAGARGALIVAGPCVARVIAAQWSKDDVRQIGRAHV